MHIKKAKMSLYKYSIIFISICGVLIFSVSCIIYLYSDDVYYATFLKSGFRNFVNMNIDHYMNVNGRTFVHILNEIILFFDTKLFIVINPIMIVGFAFIASKCTNFKNSREYNKENIYISTAITLFFIMCLPKEMICESLYWISGSMNYMFPAFCLILLYYILKINIIFSKGTILLFVFSLLTGATTEQGGFVAVVMSMLAVLTALLFQNKPKKKSYILAPFFAIIGLMTVILAPSTNKRLGSSIIERISGTALGETLNENLPRVSTNIAGSSGINSILIILILVIFFITLKDKRVSRLFITAPAIIALMLYQRILNIYTENMCITVTILTTIYIMLWGLSILKHEKYRDVGIFIIGAVSLQAFMLISPVLGMRTLLITGLFLSASIGSLAVELIEIPIFMTISALIVVVMLVPLNLAIMLIVIFIVVCLIEKAKKAQLLVIAAVFILYFTPILKGYYTNHIIIKENVANIAKAQLSGELYWDIDLVKPYCHEMFYENSYFQSYFLKNNNLGENTNIYLISKNYKPIFFNNKRLKSPMIKKDISYFPLRDIYEAAGGVVSWDSNTGTIAITIKDTKYVIEDKNSITKIENGITNIITLDNTMESFYNRTYIPESVFVEFLNISEENDKILITLKEK